MKTFSTSGTGSGQTLSEIESDKIPIYATESDAETDLTNLNVGQIIAIITIGAERLAYVVNENGTKKIKDLTANVGTGAPVGSLISMYKKSSPSGYLYCDGSTFDQTKYPALYQYLGSNVLPDYRECVAVGAEQNTTDTIASHDVYTEGQFKDDCMQEHGHIVFLSRYGLAAGSLNGVAIVSSQDNLVGNVINARVDDVTHGKQKAVYIYIKATSGLTENQQENVLNIINENLSYSTTEHKTGKKWYDGKDIYSKVVIFSSVFNLSTTDWTIINNKLSASDLALLQSIKNVISCSINIPVNNTYMIYENLTFAIDGSNIKLQDNKSFTVQANSAMTLEYTKTTDN